MVSIAEIHPRKEHEEGNMRVQLWPHYKLRLCLGKPVDML